MGCSSCKDRSKVVGVNKTIERNLVVNILFFLFSIILLLLVIPIIIVGGVYLLFNTIVLDKDTNLIPSLSFIGDVIYNKNKETKEIDDEFELTESEFELLDVEEVGKNG